MCDDLIPVGSDRECLNYPTEILFCESCKTAHQNIKLRKRFYLTIHIITGQDLLWT